MADRYVAPAVRWQRPRRSGPATPLVVLLHGRGADEHDLFGVTGRLPRAFAYASVRAPVALDDGGYTWFENRGAARPVASSLEASVRMLRRWLDDPMGAGKPERCYLFGFSAGMMMAAALIFDDPQRFAGAVLLSGALAFDDARPVVPGRLQDIAIFYGRGSLDDVIAAPLVRRSADYLREQSGAHLTEREYGHAHAISNRELDDIAAWFGERE